MKDTQRYTQNAALNLDINIFCNFSQTNYIEIIKKKLIPISFYFPNFCSELDNLQFKVKQFCLTKEKKVFRKSIKEVSCSKSVV